MTTGDGGFSKKLVSWIIGLVMVVVFSIGILPNVDFSTTPPQAVEVSGYYEQTSFPLTDIEWNDWMEGITQYNVDVFIPDSHAWQRHGDSMVNQALRCVEDNGIDIIISEDFSRRLHLLCDDGQGNQYVIIIEKIRKSTSQYRNAQSTLNTAFKLEHGANIGSYLENELMKAKIGRLVNLRFGQGEVKFMPYR